MLAALTLTLALALGLPGPAAADVTQQVKAMYEEYPFPSSDAPADAQQWRHAPSQAWSFSGPTHVPELTQFVFGGFRDWTQPTRVLIAGGGTGHMTVSFARALQDMGSPAEVVFLDLTSASLAQARELYAAAGVRNTRFVQGSLMALADMDLGGPFDVIDCTGVLHHTADPPGVLRQLSAALKPGGGIGMMLYGSVGRAGIYQMRDAMRQFGPDQDRAVQLDRLWGLLETAPASNWLRRSGWEHGERDAVRDIALMDAFLHPQDVAYRVEEIHALADGAGLRVASFLREAYYDPASFVKNETLLADIQELPRARQQQLAELLAGFAGMHEFYLVKKENPVVVPRMPTSGDNVLVPRMHREPRKTIADMLRAAAAGGHVRGKMHVAVSGGLDDAHMMVPYVHPELTANVLVLCDGQRTLADIFATLRDSYAAKGIELAPEEYNIAATTMFRALNSLGWMALRLK